MNTKTLTIKDLRKRPSSLGVPGYIVACRERGVIVGHQLRIGSLPGQSAYYSAGKNIDAVGSFFAAKQDAELMGIETLSETRRKPTRLGVPTARTKMQPGFWHEWQPRLAGGHTMYLCVSWKDLEGRARCSKYSLAVNKPRVAMERAVAARVSGGAIPPIKAALLRQISAALNAGPTPG